MGDGSIPKSQPKTRRRAKRARRPKRQQLPPYNVVLLDDNVHTYDYVIEMLARLFGHERTRGYQLARQVDASGRAIVMTTHRELAELKRDQIVTYGADWRIAGSTAGMRAVVEPAAGA
jgi:ATP-dependent Clp protease adaptor protein ClpS